MDDYCFADDVTDSEPVCQKDHKSAPLHFKKRWQIAGVMRMPAVVGVKMALHMRKWVVRISRAGLPLVNMKAEYSAGTTVAAFRQACNLNT